MDHFTLPVEPEDLRTLRRKLALLSTNLADRAATAHRTPAEIGSAWTGRAATTIKEAMRSLGGVMDRLAGDLERISEGVASLSADYEDALDRVRTLNRRWEDAEQEYAAAARDPDLAEAAQSARDTEQESLTSEYDELHERLQHRTRALGLLLAEHTPVQAVESTVALSRRH